MRCSRGARWLVAALLTLPAAVPYAVHLLDCPPGSRPTGFIQSDTPYYMANAREHFDDGRFHALYGLPFSADYDTPRVYFQPHTLVLGVLWRWTGLDPGLVWVLFGALAAIVCARVAVSLYAEVADPSGWAGALGLVAFFWGGGILCLAGGLASLLFGAQLPLSEALFEFDPSEGWWFLNFGRNLVLPSEALYHALFFGAVLAVLRGRLLVAAGLALLLSACHPFTGIELLAILLAWASLEVVLRRPTVPPWFAVACAALVGLHLTYYLGFLGRSPEHRALSEQWALAWVLAPTSALLAYLPVGLLALYGVVSEGGPGRFLAVPRHRLLLVWFLVALALVKHELLLAPRQPLHFTRGYVWTPLYLMGANALTQGLRRLGSGRRRALAVGASLALLVLLTLDNTLWLGTFAWRASARREAVCLDANEQELMAFLGRPEHGRALLLAQDARIAYLATVYTPLRAWASHYFNTPYSRLRHQELFALFGHGAWVDAWNERPVLIVSAARRLSVVPERGRRVFRNDGFSVFRVEPSPPRPGP